MRQVDENVMRGQVSMVQWGVCSMQRVENLGKVEADGSLKGRGNAGSIGIGLLVLAVEELIQ